jgi:hypothetical protein
MKDKVVFGAAALTPALSQGERVRTDARSA